MKAQILAIAAAGLLVGQFGAAASAQQLGLNDSLPVNEYFALQKQGVVGTGIAADSTGFAPLPQAPPLWPQGEPGLAIDCDC